MTTFIYAGSRAEIYDMLGMVSIEFAARKLSQPDLTVHLGNSGSRTAPDCEAELHIGFSAQHERLRAFKWKAVMDCLFRPDDRHFQKIGATTRTAGSPTACGLVKVALFSPGS